jgi:hypothetical protein
MLDGRTSMVTNRLVVAVLIFTAFCVACVPVPPPPQQQVSGRESTQKCLTDDGPAFANSVQALGAPDRRTRVAKPSGSPLSAQQLADITNAYCNAPESFRRQLDNIDFVYVDAGACNTPGDPKTCPGLAGNASSAAAWGQRWVGGYTQIGLPAGLWPMGQSAELYPAYESDILDALVPWRTTPLRFSAPTYNPNNANTSWMTVLAALAHEAGHIRWYQANHRSGFGFGYDFKRLTDCNFFAGWQTPTDIHGALEPPAWRMFNSKTATNDHANAPKLSAFSSGTSDQDLNNALNQLFLPPSQPWASFFGSMSPDEDFVETYKFSVLIGAGLTSLPITIPVTTSTSTVPTNVTQDIPYAYTQNASMPNLKKKVRCIKRWM